MKINLKIKKSYYLVHKLKIVFGSMDYKGTNKASSKVHCLQHSIVHTVHITAEQNSTKRLILKKIYKYNDDLIENSSLQ